MLAQNGVINHELSETVDHFLRHMANQRRAAPNTVSAYHNDLTQFHDYLLSSQPGGSDGHNGVGLEDVDAGTVAGFVLYLRTRGYSQATIARKVAAVKSFFRYAAEAGLVDTNPALALDSPQVQRAAPQAARPADVEALLDAAGARDTPDDLRNRAMITLLYHSGMRVGEVVALDTGDLDLERGTVRCRGRAGRVRSIPVASQASGPLRAYLANGRPYLARGDGDGDETEALFLNHRGTRLTRQGFWLIMKDRARQAGIGTQITPHSLRHSFALHHLGSGTALRALKDLLGHVNISTTQIYAHASARNRAPTTPE
jgi:integrase/recombinase XerD